MRKEKHSNGGIKNTEGNYNSAEGTNGENLRENIKKVIDQRQKVPQTAEQNPNEVKAPSENTRELKLTSGIENHGNCIRLSENKALNLEKQEHMPIDNT